MSKGRLTRHELSWLLTQEAQNAAERLRVGVQVLRTQAPPPMVPGEDPVHGVETSLDALDDVMKMLSSLNQRAAPQSGPISAARRGRIDIAALLVEVAPGARVSIEPGSGTEVYGEEADFRRMIQVLIGHGSGEGASVTVRRDGEEVKVSVALGPDSSPTAETERAWLNRVALRYGGRHELEGGSEALVFPADGARDRSEASALRKELDEARKQGEVYARELAAVFDRDEDLTGSSDPPLPGVASNRLVVMTKLCAGIAAELNSALGPAKSELASARRHDLTDDQLDTIRRRISHVHEVVAGLAAFGALRADEMAVEVDLVDVARATVKSLANIAERDDVKVSLRVRPEGSRVYVRHGTKALSVLAREVVAHAIEASPRGSRVEITVSAPEGNAGARLIVDDSGSALPVSGRGAFLALETHAGAYGRPSGLPLFLAAELAASHGASLALADVPLNDSAPGGLRVTITFART